QGDPRFGDIRIGGMAQAPGTLAFTYSTPPFNGGTLAGDIFLNTAQPWQVNGTTYDLETVAIHELGHALGMSHSQVAAADMYAYYQNTKQSLTADDIQGIQSNYGANLPDSFDATASNNTSGTASNINSLINDQGQVAISKLSIGPGDVDWYYVNVPSTTTGTMSVTVQSANLSSLSPSVIVYNQSLLKAGQASAP